MLEPVTRGFSGLSAGDEGFTVGADGNLKVSISSSSSIEGKAVLKSVRLSREDIRGDEDADDVGDGGPKLDAGIRV